MDPNTKEWTYGDSWDRYRVQPGEIWGLDALNSEQPSMLHLLACADIERGATEQFVESARPVHITYCDPPWTQGLLSGFRTKASIDAPVPGGRSKFLNFLEELVGVIYRSGSNEAFVEMGSRHAYDLLEALTAVGYSVVKVYPIVYSRKNPAVLVHATRPEWEPTPTVRLQGIEGLDDMYTPERCVGEAVRWFREKEQEQEQEHTQNVTPVVFDPCAGRGLTALAADKAGAAIAAGELNPRRLAVAIEKLHLQVLERFRPKVGLGKTVVPSPRVVGYLPGMQGVIQHEERRTA